MGAEPYDLRSNMKGKPGSQGTLFQVRDKGLLNPAQRWPRGYSPDRQAEVREGLRGTTVWPTMKVDPPRSSEEVRSRLVDTISRSTVPVEHLQDLRTVHDQPYPGHEATYWPRNREMGINMFGTGDSDGDKNLIHEIGHHVDDNIKHITRGMTRMGSPLRNDIVYAPSGNGRSEAAEGVADNYHVEHYRTRGRNPQPVTSGRYEDTGNDEYEGYKVARPRTPIALGPQFQQGKLF